MSSQIQITGETKVKSLTGVLTGTSGVVGFLPIDVSLGIPQLDVNGKILVSQLPNSVMEYQGTWNAATNTPYLVNGVGNAGDVWLVSTGGVHNFGAGNITFVVSDQVIFSNVAEGSIWQKASGSNGTVTSVALTETGDSLNITGSPIVNAGTINIGFNGTNLQYVNGAGNLTTFPILTGYVPYTGATQDVDLGAFSLNGKSLHIKGTAGNGHLGLKHQSAAATGSANESLIYADSLGDLSWQNANLYLSKFITSANTANRSYTFPNATCNIPDDSLVVHLAGTETITGAKTFSGYTTFTSTVDITSGLTFSNSGFTLVLQPPTLSVNRTVTLPNGTGTLALTSDLTGYLTAVTATSPLSSSGGTTPNITIALATTSTNGYLSSTDWTTFNNKQTALNGTGFVKISGTTISYDNSTYALDSAVVHNTGAETINGLKTFSVYTTHEQGALIKHGINLYQAGYTGIGGSTLGLVIGLAGGGLASLNFNNTTNYTYTFPSATGTIALVGGAGVGTVTSVAALTLGTSGTDLSSSVANSTTTPVITLNVPTASATNRGALSSADWTTFNNKQSALTNPVTGTGNNNYLAKFTSTGSTIGNSVIQEASSNIGIGVSPSYKLDVYDASTDAVALFNSGNANGSHIRFGASGTVKNFVGNSAGFITSGSIDDLGLRAVGAIRFATNGAGTDMLLDASGNLGLGITPSAWAALTALQVGNSSLSSYLTEMHLSANAYYNSGWKYVGTGFGARYSMNDAAGGAHAWFTAPSGTAGNAITFTQAMTLNASGNLGLGTPSPDGSDWNASARLLHIYQNTTNGALLKLESSNTNGILSVGNNQMQFGTVTDDTLILYTNSAERMRIWNTTGNVNIGTTPASDSGYKLDVNGTGRFSASGNSLRLNSTSNDVWATFIPQTGHAWRWQARTTSQFSIYNETLGVFPFTIESTGAATFSSTITATQFNSLNSNASTPGFGVSSGNGMYNAGTNIVGFSTASTNRLTIDATGAATFTSTIECVKRAFVSGASTIAAYTTYTSAGSNTAYLGVDNSAGTEFIAGGSAYAVNIIGVSAYPMIFGTNNTERMRITSGGNVQIDDSSSGSKLAVRGGNSTYPASSSSSYTLSLNDPTSSAINVGGSIIFQGFKTSTSNIGNFGGIVGKKENGTAGNESGFLGFLTSDSSGTFTERMRITSGGALCLGVTSAYGTNLLNVNGGIYATSSIAAVVAADIDMFVFQNTGATYSKACVVASMTATGGTGSYFFYGQQSTSTAAIKIFSNGNIQNTNNSYGAISDARLKENIKDATPKLDDLMKVKVRNYNLKGESNKQLGVISQELEAIFPNMIEESTNMGENMKIKGVKYSVFVPMLIKAVQEQQQQINELKQLINK